MILRRVIVHVREQNWTAIAIDFVIVVSGVFLGIQLGNWNSARADERLGRVYAERLLVDLRKDRVTRQILVDYYEAVRSSAERTVELLNEPGSDPLALVVHAYRATEFTYNPKSRATWDEIVSSGHVSLLPRAVGERVSDYFASDPAEDVLEALQTSSYRHRVRSVMPHAVQQAIRARCGDVRDEAKEVVGFSADCALDLDDAVVAEAARVLRSDPEVLEGLRYQFSNLTMAWANVGGDLVYLDRALAALEGAEGEGAP